MKRLALLAVTAIMALTLSACGEHDKKSEVKVTTEQTHPNDATGTPSATTTTTTTTPENTQ